MLCIIEKKHLNPWAQTEPKIELLRLRAVPVPGQTSPCEVIELRGADSEHFKDAHEGQKVEFALIAGEVEAKAVSPENSENPHSPAKTS